MSPLSLRRRSRGADHDLADAVLEDVLEDLPPIASAADQATANVAAKAATIGLMVCLVLGPVGAVLGGVAVAAAMKSPPAQQAAVVDDSNQRAAAGELAQRVVVAWLAATRANPGALVDLVPGASDASLPERAFKVTEVGVSGIGRAGEVWSVTVAATVTDALGVTARRFYRVPVQVTGDPVAGGGGASGTVTALTLPAPVSPPSTGAAPQSAYRGPLGETSAVGVTVTQFLGAYLAGTGDVSRYLTPGVTLTALTPAPYTDVSLEDLRADTNADGDAVPGDGDQMRVLATVTATVTRQQTSACTYALSLTARAGRWEIAGIDPAPASASKTPSATPAPGTTSPGDVSSPSSTTSS